MSKNIEIEVKSKLTKDEYNYLVSVFKNKKKYEQINHYFDTKEFSIFNAKCGLRVREKNQKFELTLKSTLQEGMLEINQEISANQYYLMENCKDFPNGEVKDYITHNLHIDVKNLIHFSSIKTTRIDIHFFDSLISIDKSEYPNIVDYEIECESISKINAEKDLSAFLKKYKINYQNFSISKLERAIKDIKKFPIKGTNL